MNTNDGGPAFPTGLHDIRGASLRDWFAGMALQGLVARGDCRVGMDQPSESQQWASKAYRYADAMLAARSAK